MTTVIAPGPAQTSALADRQAEPARPGQSGSNLAGDGPAFDLIELLFFAYRDFVADADRLLERYKFGRAHHRVVHFVNRHPGLTIAELLDILRITKQSLNRVLKELVEQGYVETRAGSHDRRQRNLFVTGAGRALAEELALTQSGRFARALSQLPPDGRENAIKFLLSMIDEHERETVSSLIWGTKE